MIITKLLAICPVCEEQVEIDIDEDTVIEACRNEILLSFKCKQCGEYIDQEALEKD